MHTWHNESVASKFIIAGIMALCMSSGCSTTNGGMLKSWWPSKSASTAAPSSESSFASKMGGAAKGIRGQFASMGTAVSSMYGKAKTAVSSTLSKPGAVDKDDPTSLANMPESIGAELWVTNGQYYEAQGQFGKALDNYTKALEKDPNNAAALVSTARLYDRQNQTDKAIEYYQKAVKAKSDDAGFYNDLALAFQKQGKLPAAKDNLQRAIAIDPKNVRYHNNLATVLVENGQSTDAVKQLEQVLSPAIANYNVAYLHFTKQNIPAAQQHLQSALQIDPNLQQARDLMNQLGGSQGVQTAMNAYQMAGNVLQTVQGIATSNAQPNVQPASVPSIPPSLSLPINNVGLQNR